MKHMVHELEEESNLRMGDLLNEAGVQLLSHSQKGTSSFQQLFPSQLEGKKSTYQHEAFLCLKESANLGSMKGTFNLGVCYEQGWGTPVNLKKVPIFVQYELFIRKTLALFLFLKAVECYEEAARSGHAGAQYNLGLLHCYGKIESSDPTKALNFLRQAARQGLEQAWPALLILLQPSNYSIDRKSSTTSLSVLEDISEGLPLSSSNRFHKAQSEPHCLGGCSNSVFKDLSLKRNHSVSFYIGNN